MKSMSDSVLLIDRSDGIATLTMNRPKAMNALSTELRAALAGAFEQLAGDDSVGVVILTGQGERAFTAGLDLKELSGESGSAAWGESTPPPDPVSMMMSYPHPIIGAINGVAITGGFEVALACDVLVASTNARFADTHARVGLLPGWGLSQRLSRLIGISRAKELSLTGNFLNAEQASDWGLVNRVLPPGELLPHCRSLAKDMLSCPREMVARYKEVIDTGFAETFGRGLEYEAEQSRAHGREVTPEQLATNRQKVTARGRQQDG
jgi:enoyl-CoA hydratase/carnithine racemase